MSRTQEALDPGYFDNAPGDSVHKGIKIRQANFHGPRWWYVLPAANVPTDDCPRFRTRESAVRWIDEFGLDLLAPYTLPATNPIPRVLIVVEGGVVQEVLSDGPVTVCVQGLDDGSSVPIEPNCDFDLALEIKPDALDAAVRAGSSRAPDPERPIPD